MKLQYITPNLEVSDLGDDLITTSREWDTEEMPIERTQGSAFAW